MPLKPTPKILSSLDGLESRRKSLLKLGKAMMEAYEGTLYPVDIFALGAIKRTISTIAGFKILVQSLNMICARTLLRTQIDTALRFYSVFIVDDPHAYALAVYSGEQINKIKDSRGKLMKDAYLVEKLSQEYPWIKTVYNNLSGYIHLSSSHLFSPLQNIDAESKSIKIEVSEEDIKFTEFSWLEVINCLNESIDIFIKYLEGWIFTKSNPELIARRKKEKTTEKP
jgi:hypothetical protein